MVHHIVLFHSTPLASARVLNKQPLIHSIHAGINGVILFPRRDGPVRELWPIQPGHRSHKRPAVYWISHTQFPLSAIGRASLAFKSHPSYRHPIPLNDRPGKRIVITWPVLVAFEVVCVGMEDIAVIKASFFPGFNPLLFDLWVFQRGAGDLHARPIHQRSRARAVCWLVQLLGALAINPVSSILLR